MRRCLQPEVAVIAGRGGCACLVVSLHRTQRVSSWQRRVFVAGPRCRQAGRLTSRAYCSRGEQRRSTRSVGATSRETQFCFDQRAALHFRFESFGTRPCETTQKGNENKSNCRHAGPQHHDCHHITATTAIAQSIATTIIIVIISIARIILALSSSSSLSSHGESRNLASKSGRARSSLCNNRRVFRGLHFGSPGLRSCHLQTKPSAEPTV